MKAFDRIIGYESVKSELYQIIDMFKNGELYERMGAKLPKGVLIYGAPGLGKTMLANAMIEECNVQSYTLKKNKDDKESIKEIAETFELAAKEAPSIILIDDIDKFSESERDDVDDKTFAAIQAGIDGVKNRNVLVVATANNLRKLPTSLKRNGRFDRKIGLRIPTSKDAAKIIEYYMKPKMVNKDINYDDVSKMISYTSCADLETIINESAIYAAYERKESIDINDIMKAYLKDQFDLPDEDFLCSKEEIEVTSLHEAGHAVIAEALKKGGVGFVSIQTIGSNSAQGFTHLCEEYKRRPENILIALGGKAAVELFYQGRCASGCQSDIEKAARLLRDGIGESGTCGIGMIDVATQRFPNTSESLNSRGEAVVHAELERYLFLTRDILIKNKDFFNKVAEALKSKKYLLHSEIMKLREECNVVQAIIE